MNRKTLEGIEHGLNPFKKQTKDKKEETKEDGNEGTSINR